MSATNAELVRGLADAFNARDFDRARSLLSDEAQFIDVAAGVTANGADGCVAYLGVWTGAFSDMQIETLAVVADGKHVAGEFIVRGIHDGTLQAPNGPIPPTGRKFEERFVWYTDVADGRITSIRDYYNTMSLMTQLGLIPQPSEASA